MFAISYTKIKNLQQGDNPLLALLQCRQHLCHKANNRGCRIKCYTMGLLYWNS